MEESSETDHVMYFDSTLDAALVATASLRVEFSASQERPLRRTTEERGVSVSIISKVQVGVEEADTFTMQGSFKTKLKTALGYYCYRCVITIGQLPGSTVNTCLNGIYKTEIIVMRGPHAPVACTPEPSEEIVVLVRVRTIIAAPDILASRWDRKLCVIALNYTLSRRMPTHTCLCVLPQQRFEVRASRGKGWVCVII